MFVVEIAFFPTIHLIPSSLCSDIFDIYICIVQPVATNFWDHMDHIGQISDNLATEAFDTVFVKTNKQKQFVTKYKNST